MQLYQKQKSFFKFFSAFFEFILISEPFQQKDDSYSWFIYGIIDSEKGG